AVLGLANAAVIVRYTRNEMLEQLPLDYVRTARSKGLRESFVVTSHVLRNGLIPVVTLVALGIPTIFGGAIVTEQIFRVPGIGELLVTVTELAKPFDMSLPAVSKHLKVLEQAGLISRGRDAQWRPARLEADRLREATKWMERYRIFWEKSLDRLDAHLRELQKEKEHGR